MPLFYQQDINYTTRLAVWKIEEGEAFFLSQVPVQRNITHPHKRLQHLAGRYLLRYLFPGFPHHEIEIADTRKPFLQNEQCHFSISHCGDYAAAVVSSDRRVGIDLEMITPRIEKIKYKFLHPDELDFVNQLADQKLSLLTLLWSAKEAMFKWYGLGEVDFSEMLRILPFKLMKEGIISAEFIKGAQQQHLTVQYKLMNDLALTWMVTT